MKAISVFFLVFGLCFYQSCDSSQVTLSQFPIGGNIQAVDKKGQKWNLQEFPDPVVLVFFGYTQCPDFCPNTLTKLKKIADALPPGKKPKVVFVSVDPERDDVDLVQKFVSFYLENAIGLSFSKSTTLEILKQYGAYSEKNTDGITIDHSTYIYVLDKYRKTRALLKSNDSEDDMRNTILSTFAVE